MSLTLKSLNQIFTIHRLNPQAAVPAAALNSSFFAVTRTEDELSIVVPEIVQIPSDQSEPNWTGFKVMGQLEFSLIGVLAGICNTLANAGVSIFALSTFDTDYILVKQDQIETAKVALRSAGYLIMS